MSPSPTCPVRQRKIHVLIWDDLSTILYPINYSGLCPTTSINVASEQ